MMSWFRLYLPMNAALWFLWYLHFLHLRDFSTIPNFWDKYSILDDLPIFVLKQANKKKIFKNAEVSLPMVSMTCTWQTKPNSFDSDYSCVSASCWFVHWWHAVFLQHFHCFKCVYVCLCLSPIVKTWLIIQNINSFFFSHKNNLWCLFLRVLCKLYKLFLCNKKKKINWQELICFD